MGGTQLDGDQLIVLLACLWVPTVPLFLVSFSLAFTIWTLAVGMIRATSLRVRRERHPAESLQQDFDRACDLFEAKLLHRPPQVNPSPSPSPNPNPTPNPNPNSPQASPPPPQPTAFRASRASNGSEEEGAVAGRQAGGQAGGGAAQGGLAFARCWNACISQVS